VIGMYGVGLAAIADVHVPELAAVRTAARAGATDPAAGFRAVQCHAGPRWIVLGIGIQTFVRGLLTVLVVVASIELLGMGEPGVGTLNAAIGLGGLVGAIASVGLTGRRLLPAFTLSLAGWGLPLIVVGAVAVPAVAIAAMTAIGISTAILEISGYTLAQRMTPNADRLAVLGILNGVSNGGVALGGLVAPVLAAWLGIQGALIVSGAILPVVALLSWPLVRHLDERGTADPHRVDRLRADPIFAPLSLATVEWLAGSATAMTFDDGSLLLRQGDPGDAYLLLDAGDVEVIQDGIAVRRLGIDSGVGEIALLRDSPRTATVRAIGSVRAIRIDRDTFLVAVTGHPVSRRTATTRAHETLAADADRPAAR
jgi:MFS family permease